MLHFANIGSPLEGEGKGWGHLGQFPLLAADYN